MSRTRVIILVVIALLAVFLLFKICGADDDAEIRALLNEMIAAAEARDTQMFMEHFSLKYKDSGGNSYFVLQQMVRRIFGQLEELKVDITNLDIYVTGDSAYASMEVVTRAKMSGQMAHPFGSEDRPQTPRITLEKERLKWKIVKVEGVDNVGYFNDF